MIINGSSNSLCNLKNINCAEEVAKNKRKRIESHYSKKKFLKNLHNL